MKFFVHPDGSVVLLPKVPVTALRGMLKTRRGRPVTTDEMTEAKAKKRGESATHGSAMIGHPEWTTLGKTRKE